MPYIIKELREEIEPELGALVQKLRSMEEFNSNNGRAGILNYIITDLLDSCFGPLSDAKYKDYNEAIGMLECCKLEFYRKAAAPYEDMKEKQNGRVLDGGIKGFGLTRPNQTNDITGKDVKRIWDKVINDISKDTLKVFMAPLKPGVTAFIKANSYKLADFIFVNEILTSKEYANIDPHSTSTMLKHYKEFEDLEPEIKNAFTAKERDGLNSNFTIFVKINLDKE